MSTNNVENIKVPRKNTFINDWFPPSPMFLSCAVNQIDKWRNLNACVIFLLLGIYLSKRGDDVTSQERCDDKCENKSSLNKGRLMCCSKREL